MLYSSCQSLLHRGMIYREVNKMARQKKNYKALNCKVEITIWQNLDEHCKNTGSNKTFVVEKAIQQYLRSYEEQQNILNQLNKKK